MIIHPTALVDPHAELGKDVHIGPFAIIEKDVTIGDGTIIGPRASVMQYSTLGKHCRVHAGAIIGDLPQDMAFAGGKSHVTIGDNSVIRECVTIHRGTKVDSVTKIGSQCFLMAMSHFAHNVSLGNQVIVVGGALLAGYVEVGDRAFISGNVVVHQFVRIGRLAMLGGACGVSKDVPPFCTVRPVAVNILLGLNVIGMRRAGIGSEERILLNRAFEILFRSDLNLHDALNRTRVECGNSPCVDEIIDFTMKSKRGICRPQKEDDDESANE